MKNLFNITLLLAFTITTHINAQTSSNNSLLQAAPSANLNDTKSSFIRNQDYLSPSALTAYSTVTGDSLKGFDEKGTKAYLSGIGIPYGPEYIGFINISKREYIKKKYHIGDPFITQPKKSLNNNSNSTYGNKPIGGGNSINVAPCVNEDFELTPAGPYFGAGNATAIQGWTISSQAIGACPNGNPNFVAGSPEFWIVNTPVFGLSAIGTLPASPFGGSKVAQLNNTAPTGLVTKMVQTFPVTSANTLFQFAYAGQWEDGGAGHDCCTQPGLKIKMYDCVGAPLTCSSLTIAAVGQACATGASGYSVTGTISWTNWVVKYIDLTPFVGSCITIEVINADCTLGGHYGMLFFDAKCGGQLLGTSNGLGGSGGTTAGPVSFCAGSGQAVIQAPLGYASYQWYAPITGAIPPSQGGAAPTLTITNPIAGTTYTVILVTGSGCTFTATNLVSTSTINIVGQGSSPTCPNGASGSATVVGNGSGSGYTYTWTNSAGATVGSASVATGLAAGAYSVVLGGLGVAGCGTAMTTVTVTSAPPPLVTLLRNYCGNEAYLASPLTGSNFQWYNGNVSPPSPISFVNGGNASSYTVTNPFTQGAYILSYLSSQGCQDSIKYLLSPTTPGIMNVAYQGTICPGATNGSATINMYPVNTGVPTNIFTVTPASAPNTATVTSLASNTFIPTGLPAGTYSLAGFDGSCKYNTTFNISTLNYNFTVTPQSSTLCSGVSAIVSLNFNTTAFPGQYTYTWSPSTFLINNNSISSQITPTCAPGQINNLTYTIVATSSLASCQVTKTMSIMVINPLTPTLTAIPNLCDNGSSYSVTVVPGGGTYTMGTIANGSLIINPGSGIITPSLAAIGVNTFSYNVGVQQCTASATGTFHVSHYNTAALTSSVPPLCVTNAPFDLMNIVMSTATGTWSNVSGLGVTGAAGNYSFNPAPLNTGTYNIVYNTVSSPIAGVCNASAAITVSVTKTSTPTITAGTPAFCTNHAPVTLSAAPGGGSWSGTGISPAGIVTPSLLIVGVYNYTYTVNDGPCVNTNTVNIYSTQFNPATITGNVPDLCGVSSPTFNMMGIVQSTINGSWTGPGIIAPQGKLLNPLALPANTYTYTYKTTSTPPTMPPGVSAASCPDIQSISVVIANPTPPNITQPNPRCNTGDQFQLSVTPATGTWIATQYITTGGLFTPSLSMVGNNMIQYVTGSSTCSAQQTKYVSIEAFVPANITTTLIPDKCTTGSIVDLSVFAASGSGSWSGPGVSGSSFDPNTAGQGSFVLTHNSASSPSGLCPDQATVAVNVYSLQPPVISKVGPLCNSAAPARLQPSPVGGLFGGSNNSAITSEGLFNPASGIIGDNIITYSIISGPCVAYAQTTITLERYVSADLSGIPDVGGYCKNEPSGQLFLDQFVQNAGGVWSGNAVSNKMFIYANANAGNNNIVDYMIKSVPLGLCIDTARIRIRVKDSPDIRLKSSVASASGCAPLKIEFSTDAAFNMSMVKWDLGDGAEQNGVSRVEHTFTNPGTYTVVFHPTGECAQPVPFNVPVKVFENPKANFSVPDEIYISNPEVQLSNLSTVLGNNKYEWKIAGLYQANDIETKVLFPAIGRYPITLTAISPNGCKDVMTKVIEVKNEFNIYIPGSFTPNSDFLNDLFMPKFSPYGLDEKTYEMEIFDRWGHSVFKTKDPAKGWDGTIQNKGNDPLKEDVYVFKIKYKDVEGNVYDKIGHVALIR